MLHETLSRSVDRKLFVFSLSALSPVLFSVEITEIIRSVDLQRSSHKVRMLARMSSMTDWLKPCTVPLFSGFGILWAGDRRCAESSMSLV